MATPFSDITLYAPTTYTLGTTEYSEEIHLQNYVTDLYVQKMYGYKPPRVTRICIQPAYYNIWPGGMPLGSVMSVAVPFNYDEYKKLDKAGKYRYVLNVVQAATLLLCNEYADWDRVVFERAYTEVLESNFMFQLTYPAKLSPGKKSSGQMIIEKTEGFTTIFVLVQHNNQVFKVKLFTKKNTYWYDIAYTFAKHCKWFNKDVFGINYTKEQVIIQYNLTTAAVSYYRNGVQLTLTDFEKLFAYYNLYPSPTL